jgi:magnesium chelatase subunit H
MTRSLTAQERDQIVLKLYEQLLEVEQRLIPTGLHVFGQPSKNGEMADLLRMVASFDRPEVGIRSLPDLIAAGLGLPEYQRLVNESATSSARLQERERVEAIMRDAIATFLPAAKGEEAAAYLSREASVPQEASLKVFNFLAQVRQRLSVNHELDALTRALRGEYVEPGPGADIIQNPDILPTGRNIYALNPYGIPSPVAYRKSEAVVAALLQRYLAEQGRYPEAMAMVLWGTDNIKTQGEGVAQALGFMGVEPRRDQLNRVTDVEVVPLERLGRPRIDVVMTVSGIFRDLFGATMALLDKAVRRVAERAEPVEMNFVRKHVQERMADGGSFENGVIRIFSNAPGNYGTNVDAMVLGSQWERPDEIGDLFVRRKCFAYGREAQGREARALMEQALARVEVTYQNIDTLEVGITDVDHYFEYLGGVSQAVEKRAGGRPKIYLSDALSPAAKIRSLEETVRLETRTKTLNPKWYEGMLKHGFSGVAQIEHHVTNTFGWSATVDAVDDWVYDEIAQTYVLDGKMLDRLRSFNPHATRHLVERLLEAHGRGFWAADEEVIDQLRESFATLEDELEGIKKT